MPRKATSISIDESLWKEFRILCLKEEIDVSKALEILIKKELKRRK